MILNTHFVISPFLYFVLNNVLLCSHRIPRLKVHNIIYIINRDKISSDYFYINIEIIL